MCMGLFLVILAHQCVGAGAGPREWARNLVGLLRPGSVSRGEALGGGGQDERRLAGGRRLLTVTRIDSISPSNGPVHGWTTVTVRGEGFTAGGNYSLIFSAGAQSKSVPASAYESAAALTFVTPPWYDPAGDAFPAARTNATLQSNGVSVDAAPGVGFLFEPRWEAVTIAPTVGSVLGGTTVMLTGYGFSSQDVYFCRFERFEGPVRLPPIPISLGAFGCGCTMDFL